MRVRVRGEGWGEGLGQGPWLESGLGVRGQVLGLGIMVRVTCMLFRDVLLSQALRLGLESGLGVRGRVLGC